MTIYYNAITMENIIYRFGGECVCGPGAECTCGAKEVEKEEDSDTADEDETA